MFLYLSLAGRIIRVQYSYEKTLGFVNGYSIDDTENALSPEINISITQKDIQRDIAQDKRYNGVAHNNTQTVEYFPYHSEVTFEAVSLYRMIADNMICYSTVLMHGAVIAKNNQAYMFTAPSGVGKTTRMLLWKHEYPDSIIVNGDKPLIKITDTEAIACGTPWCGKEGLNTNTMVPLRAIFLLERVDDGQDNSIKELSMGEAFPILLQQTHRPQEPELIKRTMQLLKSLEGKVKIYRFRSAPTREAIRLAYETARPQ